MRFHAFFLLFLLFALDGINGLSFSSSPPPNSARFRLLKRHHRSHRFRSITHIARDDQLRQTMITSRLGISAPSSSFSMPMSSGAYTGTGLYFARVQVGTPAQKFLLAVDTGSDLTWMKCQYRGKARGSGPPAVPKMAGRLFNADWSRTFNPIGCSSPLCKSSLPFSLTKCPAPSSPCLYDYGYSDGSTAQGFFANESATILLSNGHRAKLTGLVVGCTSSFVGSGFRASDGVLGLGYSETSFAARAAARFGGKFSYCLVDHLSPKNISSYLVFGDHPAAGMQYADLLIDRQLEPFYAVAVAGISIGGQMLDIPKAVWDVPSRGGAIVDSGTSLTMLAEPAYRAVTSALSRALARYTRMDFKPFEFCYNMTANGDEGRFDEITVPKLVVHLQGYGGLGSVRLEPPVKSYVIDVAHGVKCLGFSSATWPGVSTIGNILQQNHQWEFDISKRRLGFKPSSC